MFKISVKLWRMKGNVLKECKSEGRGKYKIGKESL